MSCSDPAQKSSQGPLFFDNSRMKGCLKVRSRSPSPGQQDGHHDHDHDHDHDQQHQQQCSHRKCVAFGIKVSEEVHIADEWDRTPTEPTRKLTYQYVGQEEALRSFPRLDL